jgi:hypothetical protein
MSQIAIIPQINLPAELLAQFQGLVGGDDLSQGVSSGFPIMSIRGAKWRIVEGGEEKPIYIPGTTDLAPAVRVVLLRSNPAVSKTFYADAFVEGSDAKPDCFSHDGVVPSPESQKPQATSCATCPQNIWGSKISPNGSKIKACADVRRVAVLPIDDLDYTPVLLRIPAASLGDLAQYGKQLKQRGIPYTAVVTKLSFDPDASYPKILFTFERVLEGDELTKVIGRMKDPVVDDVLGLSAPRGAVPAIAAPVAVAPAPVATPAPTAAPVATPAPTEAPKAAKGKTKGFGAAPAEQIQVPAPAAPAAAPAAPSGDVVASLNAALANLQL